MVRRGPGAGLSRLALGDWPADDTGHRARHRSGHRKQDDRPHLANAADPPLVAAEDARWMLALSKQRMLARAEGRFRQLELDEATFDASRRILTKALQGGRRLTRAEIYQLLEAQGVSPAGQRGIHILYRLSQEGTICHATREGKQFTFALLDEWVRKSRRLEPDEAIVELITRYFRSHGPATIQDFVWWSGLTVSEARAGLAMARGSLEQETFDGQTYWSGPAPATLPAAAPDAHLLPPFDEYTVAYRDRSAVLDPGLTDVKNAALGILNASVLIGGRVVAEWRRKATRAGVTVTIRPFGAPTDMEMEAISLAAERYGGFLELPVRVVRGSGP